MREAVLHVRHNGEPETEVSAAFPGVTMRSVSSMTGSGDHRKRIIELRGETEEIQAFLERFRETDPIVEARPISSLSGARVYVSMTFDVAQWDSISERLSNLGVHYRMGTTISEGWERWTVYLDDADELGDVIDHLEAAGNDVRLVKNVELSDVTVDPQLETSRVLADLTPRQRDALATAIATGYYGTDRETNVDEIADELGVARSTAWEHLVRAEEKVMEALDDYLN